MTKKIDSIKYTRDKRVHIPSKEEAGYESVSPKVAEGKNKYDIPKNPVVHRGQDPELFWLNKYGPDDAGDRLSVDIRSLYRHEHIAPERLIKGLYRTVVSDKESGQEDLFTVNELFGNALERDELKKVSEYYSHHDGWTNRMIQGDSLLVMTSLLEREGMAGQVQCLFFDPPYGISYNSNWQMKMNDRNVSESSDDHLTGEPEMIKAFRDTWELGVHSYMSYLRDRLLVAKELLSDSGSCFVQISDENVHLVRCLMDEVFGSENFYSQIIFKTTAGKGSVGLDRIYDCILWYVKDYETAKSKYRQLYVDRDIFETDSRYTYVEYSDGSYRRLTKDELNDIKKIPEGNRFRITALNSQGKTTGETSEPFEWKGKKYYPPKNRHWSVLHSGLRNLDKKNRLILEGNSLCYKRHLNDYPVSHIKNIWFDVGGGALVYEKKYVVQTVSKVIQRCILMSTDPGDLVLDPTCGSGTAAYVAEQWGRRWITIDTSRIALNIAKTRLMTAVYPYYYLYSDVNVESKQKNGRIKKEITSKAEKECTGDVRQGFVYEEVPHITLKSLANDEPPATETLYDKPYEDKKRLRVSGPFTVETLQNFELVGPDEIESAAGEDDELAGFEDRIFEHLKSAGIKTGMKKEKAVFVRIDRLTDAYLHAEGFYHGESGEKKAYIHIGPKFGTVSKHAVNEAVKMCRQRGDADWLVILGFSFESDIQNQQVTMSMGSFEVTKVRMNDDLLQEGLLKKDKKAASFVTIGEPDIKVRKKKSEAVVEILGLDIYDPIKDEVKSRNVDNIAYWMVDDDYDGSNFIVSQIFFCGGDKNEFDKWKRGLSNIANQSTKRKAERTLKIEIDDDAFERLYGFKSHPIKLRKDGQRIAVRVVSQFGEEAMKVV